MPKDIFYGRGWNSKSGKKRLNSIKIPAVINNQIVVITGAVERYFRKYCMEKSSKIFRAKN
jgi:hypothetical protein